uniref:Cupin-like domain-containing protein n=1 Tax=viral metagenome TaxID=1070528 RepID=A0A6C0ER79_9ZZZZ
MHFFISFLIFLIILFLYIHIIHQLKTSEDLEIYEMDYATNSQLQEVCDVKQPVLFEFQSIYPCIFENLSKEEIFSKYGSYDVKIKDTRDYVKCTESVDYVMLSLQSSQNLVESDSGSHYFSENNEELVNESGLSSEYKELDIYLKPSFTLQSKYDIMFGSQNTATPLRYHLNYRQFFIVKSGKIHVKMTPMKSKKYLKPIKDYDNYEFRSPINVWNPQPEYLHEMDKLKFLEFDVHAGHVLYIPAYWWYSIKYEKDAFIYSATYNSVMNCLAHLPQWVLYFLQQHNIYKKLAKTKNLEEKIQEDREHAQQKEPEQENGEQSSSPKKIGEIVEKI